jgi:hypothetical protein
MRRRARALVVVVLAVAAILFVPGLGGAEECNPNHPETCGGQPPPACNPDHAETCPYPGGHAPTARQAGILFPTGAEREAATAGPGAAPVGLALAGAGLLGALVARRAVGRRRA